MPMVDSVLHDQNKTMKAQSMNNFVTPRRGVFALAAVSALVGITTTSAFAENSAACHTTCTITPSAPASASSAPARDYLVTVGKRTVLASTLPPKAGAVPAVSASTTSHDYPVTVGKRTVMASSLAPKANVSTSVSAACVRGQFVTVGKATRHVAGCPLTGTSVAASCCL